MSKQFLDNSGLQVVADKIKTRLKTVTTMPPTANPGAVRLYTDEDTANYKKGHIYQYNNETYYCYIADDDGYYYHFYIKEIEVGATVYSCGSPEWFQKKADSISELTSDFSELGYTFSITAASPSNITVSNGGGSIVANRSSDDDLNNIGWTDITASSGTVDLNFDPTSENAQSGIAVSQALKQVVSENTVVNTWTDAPWKGDFTGYAGNIWEDLDGTVYFSDDQWSQYVLNESTLTWEPVTWLGTMEIQGSWIWTDKNNIYYSDGIYNYVLNRETSTWEPKTWYGLTELRSSYIWTDDDNIYYSNSSDQYVLNKSTSTWEEKTWNNLPENLTGYSIWKDGTNIYYSNSSDQYVLNKATDTWEPKTWNGFTPTSSSYIWTDGADIYYSTGSDQYVLDRATDTWKPKTWNINIEGNSAWCHGTGVYYSYGNYEQYQLLRTIK